MKIALDENPANNNRIEAYDKNLFKVNGQYYSHSIIITPTEPVQKWAPVDIIDLDTAHLEQLVMLKPEIIILGTGVKQVFPPFDSLIPIYDAGIGIEIMDSGAGSRSYNLLAAEGRNVVAGLIVIE